MSTLWTTSSALSRNLNRDLTEEDLDQGLDEALEEKGLIWERVLRCIQRQSRERLERLLFEASIDEDCRYVAADIDLHALDGNRKARAQQRTIAARCVVQCMYRLVKDESWKSDEALSRSLRHDLSK